MTFYDSHHTVPNNDWGGLQHLPSLASILHRFQSTISTLLPAIGRTSYQNA